MLLAQRASSRSNAPPPAPYHKSRRSVVVRIRSGWGWFCQGRTKSLTVLSATACLGAKPSPRISSTSVTKATLARSATGTAGGSGGGGGIIIAPPPPPPPPSLPREVLGREIDVAVVIDGRSAGGVGSAAAAEPTATASSPSPSLSSSSSSSS